MVDEEFKYVNNIGKRVMKSRLTSNPVQLIMIELWLDPLRRGVAPGGGGGYTHTLPIRVFAAQRGRDFEAPDLEQGIHFRGVF